MYPVVDASPEAFSTMPMTRTSSSRLFADLGNWYLVYRTKTDQSAQELAENPVTCYCIPEKAQAVKTQSVGIITWEAGQFTQNIAYAVSTTETKTFELRVGNNVVKWDNPSTYYGYSVWILYSTTYNKYYVKFFGTTYDITGSTSSTTMVQYEGDSITFVDCDKVYKQDWDYANALNKTGDTLWPREGRMILDYPLTLAAGVAYNTTDYFENWYNSNKTDGRLIKIRQLPYPPFELQYSKVGTQTQLVIPDNWKLTPDRILQFTGSAFDKYSLGKINPRWLPEFDSGVVAADEPSITDETKLFNSSFSAFKVVYDTNTWVLQPERLNDPEEGDAITVQYKVSDGMDNGLGFEFTTAGDQQYDTDFGEYLVTDRGTDIPYFTSEYLNYLRYGKFYDEQAAARSTAGGVASLLGSTVTTAASLAFAGAQMGSSGGIPGAIVGAVVGAITGAISVACTASAASDNINAKISAYQQQASSVSGTSNVSLFNMYSGNSLLSLTYEPIDQFKEMLYQYFRLFGYATDEYGIPNLSTRHWVEYIQCEPVFKGDMLWNEFKDDIKTRMSLGFRVFHRNNDTYDLTCSKANWETAIWSLYGE